METLGPNELHEAAAVLLALDGGRSLDLPGIAKGSFIPSQRCWQLLFRMRELGIVGAKWESTSLGDEQRWFVFPSFDRTVPDDLQKIVEDLRAAKDVMEG